MFKSLRDMELAASSAEDETANFEMRSMGKSQRSARHWLRVTYEGGGQYGYFHDAAGKTNTLTRSTANRFFETELAHRQKEKA